jgi:hypothetical protein
MNTMTWSSKLGPGFTADDFAQHKEKKTVAESEDVKTGWCKSGQIRQNLRRKAVILKGLFTNVYNDDF